MTPRERAEKPVFWKQPRDEAWFWAFVESVGGYDSGHDVPISPEGVVHAVRKYGRSCAADALEAAADEADAKWGERYGDALRRMAAEARRE